MPERAQFPYTRRGARLFRFAATLSVLIAAVAVAMVAKGDPLGKGRGLILAAIVLGASALVGTAMLTLPYVYRRKDHHDPRP